MFLLGVPPSQNFKDNRWVSKYRLLKQLLTTKFIKSGKLQFCNICLQGCMVNVAFIFSSL